MEYWNFYYDDEYRDECDIIDIGKVKTLGEAGDKANEDLQMRCEEGGIEYACECITFVKFSTESDDILEKVTGFCAEYCSESQDFDFERDCAP